eukprot:5128359-Amphidinium_carterae.1
MDYFKTTLQSPKQPVYTDYIIGDASQQEANIPNTYMTPTLPTQHERDEHNITQLPHRDWCKHCVQGKSRSQHHQRGGLTQSDKTKHNTGLGYATVVPYKGINTEAPKAITRFIVENGLQTTILQSDGENAIIELLSQY